MVSTNTGPGASDFSIYTDGFHDRLSRYWPEPREQLHAGGWRQTRIMLDDIKRLARGGIKRVLDLCCGEGSTAAHVAAKEGWTVTGVEIVESAVKVARKRADQYGTVVRVKLSVTEPEVAPVKMKLSYDTVVLVKLVAGESSVKLRLAYDTVVGLTSCAAPELSPVHLNLTYDTAVRIKLVTATNGATPAVSLKLSCDEAVFAKLTELPADGTVKLALSYGPGYLHAKLVAESSPAVHCNMSYDTDVHAKLATDPAVRLKLSYQTVGDLVDFIHASIHEMPLPSSTYDVVYGQDPDGLANEDRIHAFREVLRVLRPGGLFYFWHHWIPGPGWSPELLAEYWADPVTGSPRLSYDCYLEDIKAAGLHVSSVTDCSALAWSHMGAMAARMQSEAPGANQEGLPDKWLERTLQFAKRGGAMGIAVVAYKPE